MRKNKLLIVVATVLLALTGCRGRNDVGTNTDRYRKHKYDFADYIDINTIGINGHGYIYVDTKEITRDMFENDDEFMKVKKDLENMDLRYAPNSRNNSDTLVISKTEGLSNDEIVSISIRYKRDKLLSDMNTEKYAYVVHDLPDESEDVSVDMFSEDIVKIYGTEENELFYYVKPDNKVYDLMLPLTYKLQTNDEKLVENGTIVSASLVKKNSYDDEIDDDLVLYFAKNGYVIPGTETELILDKVAKPIDPETLTDENYAEIEQQLKNAIATKIEKGNIVIYSLQQSQKAIDEGKLYEYVVTYSNVKNGETVYGQCFPSIHQIGENTFVVQPIQNVSSIKQEDVNSSTDTTILHVYNQ